MDHRLTIGLVTPAWPGFATANGISTSVYQLAMGLTAIGHRPVIIALREDAPPPVGIPVVPTAHGSWPIGLKILARLGRQGDAMAAATGDAIADAVEAADAAYELDAVLIEETQGWAHRVARRQKVPSFVVLHGPWILHEAVQGDGSVENRRRGVREAKAFLAANAIIAPSRNVLEAVEGAIDLGKKPRIVIPNSFRAGAMIPPTAGGPILFVGRFDTHKGGDTMLAAFARVHAARPDARLTFAGPDRGVHRTDGTVMSMETALAALPASTRSAITAPGRLSAEEVAALRQDHSIAVVASRYENLNYTMLEAMAAGQAIVSTNAGGPAEVFEHEKTALLVPPDDPDAMAAAILRLMDDHELAQALVAAAAVELRQRFDPEKIARQIMDFVAECLEVPK